MKWTRQVVTAYVLIFVFAICFKIQSPLEPYLVEKLSPGGGDAAALYAKVQSAFNAAQAVGTFAMGPFLDRFGARSGFVLAFSSATCSYILLGMAENMNMLYLSKLPTAFMHPFMVAQTFMAQKVSDDDRPEALALLVTAFTCGATLGPTIGGRLGATPLAAQISAGGMFLNVLLAILFLGGSGNERTGTSPKAADKSKPNFIVGYRDVLTNPAVILVILTKLCSFVFHSVYETMFPLILKNEFGVKVQEMGYMFSANMFLNAAVTKFAVSPLVKKFSGSYFCLYCLLSMSSCYFCASAVMPGSAAVDLLVGLIPAHPYIPFVGFSLLISAAAFSRGAALTGVNTSVVPSHLKGTAISMEHTMFSLSRTITPIFTSWLSAAAGAAAVCTIVGGGEAVNALSWRFIGVPLVGRAQEAKKSEAQPPSKQQSKVEPTQVPTKEKEPRGSRASTPRAVQPASAPGEKAAKED